MDNILELRNVSKRFEGLGALTNVSFGVEKKQIKALIGPNGAGKTTLFNVITGFYRVTEGEIYFRGTNITRRRTDEICRLGVSRTFQIPRLFKHMTVLENVKVGCHPWTKSELITCGLKMPLARKEARLARERSLEILNLLGLGGSRDTLAENLPIGAQKLLEIARILATSPSLMLVDEPAGGLNDRESETLAEKVRALRESLDITILLVEHDMKFVMDIADEIVVLNYGLKIAEGRPDEIRNDPQVISAYLGKGFA